MSLSLGKKITCVTLPPLLAFATFAGWNLYRKAQDLRTYSAMYRTAVLVDAAASVVQDVQRERTMTIAYLGKDLSAQELQAHREKSADHFKAFRAALDNPEMDESRRTAGHSALEALEKLRNGVDASTLNQQQVLDAFMPVVQPIIELEVDVKALSDVDEMKSHVLAISALEHAKNSASRLRVRMVDYLDKNAPLTIAQVNLFAQLFATMEGPLHDTNLALTEKGKTHLADFVEHSQAWAVMRQTYERIMVRAAVGQFGMDPKEFMKKTARGTEELTEILKEETGALSAQAQASSQTTWAAFTSLALFTLLMMAGLAFAVWYVTREIVKPIQSSISKLSSSSSEIGLASSEVQRASEQVASGASEAASSLQETTSSLEEINSMIQSNANNATKAADLSSTSEGVAQKGKDSVQAVATAIGAIQESINSLIHHITESNQRIGQIAQVISEIGNKTKVINDIVFQTKLLAFNASVEAARAGEHGKGFAVVAEEVGNLAQMSGNAAKEITSMLDGSVDQVKTVIQETQSNMEILVRRGTESVENGVRTTKQCEEVLNEIVAKAALLKNVINDISRASMEQAAGTQQITSAISELDQVTHMNAAATGQVSHATESLAQQSQHLRDIVQALTSAVWGSAQMATVPTTARSNGTVVAMRPRKPAPRKGTAKAA